MIQEILQAFLWGFNYIKVNNMKKIYTLLIAIVIFFVGTGIYFVFFFNLAGDCGRHLFLEKTSPGGGYMARELVVNCGATTEYVTWFSIKNLKNGNEEQSVTIDHDVTTKCSMDWTSEQSVEIKCDVPTNDVYVNKKSVMGVSINLVQ